ncbi:MAG: glutamate-5-semialdehyde dehydrogenase, partial [Leptospiraceae bacterium]|nr:glutamate-5-semialdehyde dehydrogenase [Leptospiraceae bacterium]
LENGKQKGLSASLMDRLLLNEKRIEGLATAVREIASFTDPVGYVVRGVTLPNGLELITKQVPLGVIMVIYESRPNVTIDVASLAFKSGNVAILRGGSEAFYSNQILCKLFQNILEKYNIPKDTIVFVDQTDRSYMTGFLKLPQYIDLVVPRGGEGLIKFVTENSLIPVVKHDKGVCNMYVDDSANFQMALEVIENSKLQRPGVCNALENLFISKNFSQTAELLFALEKKGVKFLVDEKAAQFLPNALRATEEDYYTEFLDERLSVKIVNDVDEAIAEIQKYTSGHTEAILSENQSNIQKFIHSLDSAAIFVNCSTRFHDGGEFGLGAEVGISTGKLHVRGPMGLQHLTTTTTILVGKGQVRK